MDVADIVTALVKLSPEERADVLERAIHELGTQWLEDALGTAKATILDYYPPDESGKVSEK